ncbi:class I SAM-dependent methyltransferase [Yoonia sp. R2-816]|uniref:class I SAM-dependent methyltransferase n=1 Tax=Yoonia sp. R2-816 TaxID=3342638 RepID=UPI00372CC6C1
MTDLHYTNPDLVALYDTFNGWSVDRDFYAGLPGKTPIRILEVGCGTGLIARALALQGHHVTGLDPAQPMLDFAAQASGGDKVQWVCGVLVDYDAAPFDLIFMTGHAFQCMLTNEEISAFFVAAKRLLNEDGRLVFETRNPAARGWENWVPEKTTRTLAMPDGDHVTEWHVLVEVDQDIVAFQSIYQFANHRLVSDSVLRFADEDTIRRLAQDVGFVVRSVFGDWDCGPLTDESPEIIMTMTAD